MLNLGRREAPPEARDAGKPALGPAPYGNAGISASHAAATAARSSAPPPAALAREAVAAAPVADELAGSKLTVGPNIKLKGVEIADCDVLVVEGHVEATVNSKAMQIAEPGTLKGTATIDIAEIHGEFSGELTARKRLIIHGTGRVSGTIRYGKLIVAEGGELTGDVKRLDVSADTPQRTPALSPDLGLPRTPQPLR